MKVRKKWPTYKQNNIHTDKQLIQAYSNFSTVSFTGKIVSHKVIFGIMRNLFKIYKYMHKSILIYMTFNIYYGNTTLCEIACEERTESLLNN